MAAPFVTFEGLDGSGKSTHLARAARWLEERGLTPIVTQEPGGTEVGDELRRVFLDASRDRLDGLVETLLLFASRRQLLLEVIEPALAAGKLVLCDRFTDSTLAYQGYGRGLELELLREVDRLATGARRPDLTLLFDLPAADARRRGFAHREGDGGADRLDREELAFYERVRRGYLELAAEAGGRYAVIDSVGSREATAAQVAAALESIFGAGR